jgi:hypothetical protein
VRDFYPEKTQMGSITSAVYTHEAELGVNRRDANNPFQPAFERHLVLCRRRAGEHGCQEHRRHWQMDVGFHDGQRKPDSSSGCRLLLFHGISFEFEWGTVYTYPPRVHFNSRCGAVTVEQFLLSPLETRIRRENQNAC